MRRHVGIGPIDQRVIETGLDDRGLGVVRHKNCGTPPIAPSARTWASIQSTSVCVQVAAHR